MQDLFDWLQQAVDAAASDVYLLPQADGYHLFFRLAQGFVLQAVLPNETAQRWINYLKYQANMNVAEHRRVQLGAVTIRYPPVLLRLSTVGDVAQHETLVARLIYGIPSLDATGQRTVASLANSLSARGMLALSGATGSGKTTLLYQLAQTLAVDKMVMTIEDPVEILHPEFLQLQVNPQADMTYATLLKAALRHRPDILIIGEIRDRETAEVACEAAISGHIVLTTVHARSAELVPLRLKSLGVAEALVDAAIVASASVQLVFVPTKHAQVELVRWKEGVIDEKSQLG
ncbi:ATPase, T2SS/T4P/T4SS family [Lacticaseibacillus sp. N501-2]|uniref:ATPase, T2SS/T4P/T4SS family n=1 Tax=Lacticaseibacillus salsurae TaxID=3367729 RepID=UPI0038B40DC6